MRVIAYLKKNQKILRSFDVTREHEDDSMALLLCLEDIYKEFDISEPIWLSKHQDQVSKFSKTHFTPEDFIEPVDFSVFEIELYY